jgi:hypothetical protein
MEYRLPHFAPKGTQAQEKMRYPSLLAVRTGYKRTCLFNSVTDLLAVDFSVNGISAWSVDGPNLSSGDLASSLFSTSLLPYLVFLYFIGKETVHTPKVAKWGFQFLLVFVFVTIPAGIYAKEHFHTTLANVDVLHGVAESLLTITNLLIIAGFYGSVAEKEDKRVVPEDKKGNIALSLIAGMVAVAGIALSHHTEPSNALSLPTWIVHTSSILEWMVAMQLIWQHADVSGNPRWKGLTWAMMPAHASGLCACVYHTFYNSPAVIQLVALQAALTVVGNTAMAYTALRIWLFAKTVPSALVPESSQVTMAHQDTTIVDLPGAAMRPSALGQPSAVSFYSSLAVKAVALAMIVKYGELFLDAPFEPSLAPALAVVAVLSGVNTGKWWIRSTAAVATSKPS